MGMNVYVFVVSSYTICIQLLTNDSSITDKITFPFYNFIHLLKKCSGTGFSATEGENAVMIGGVACLITEQSSTSLTCTLGDSTGGTHKVEVNVVNLGNADSSSTITVGCIVINVDKSTMNSKGGQEIVVSGRGKLERHSQSQYFYCNK